MDLNAGSAAYRVRMAEQEMERDRKARLLAEGDTGTKIEWALTGVLKWGLVILPITGGVLWLLWTLVTG